MDGREGGGKQAAFYDQQFPVFATGVIGFSPPCYCRIKEGTEVLCENKFCMVVERIDKKEKGHRSGVKVPCHIRKKSKRESNRFSFFPGAICAKVEDVMSQGEEEGERFIIFFHFYLFSCVALE